MFFAFLVNLCRCCQMILIRSLSKFLSVGDHVETAHEVLCMRAENTFFCRTRHVVIDTGHVQPGRIAVHWIQHIFKSVLIRPPVDGDQERNAESLCSSIFMQRSPGLTYFQIPSDSRGC